MSSLWHGLRQRRTPVFALAPMANVTDLAFRHAVALMMRRQSGRDVEAPPVRSTVVPLWTEFVSCAGLLATEASREALLHDLRFTGVQRPVVAQLFGREPAHFERVAALCLRLGFDAIDINMGCPDHAVLRQGAGAALIGDIDRVRDIVRATRRGCDGHLPVSIKTRLGKRDIAEESERWLRSLFTLQDDISLVTVHGRTVKELSLVPCHWDEIGKVAKWRDIDAPELLLLGNGDVRSLQHGRQLMHEHGVDGVMIGRACFGTLDLFAVDAPMLPPLPPSTVAGAVAADSDHHHQHHHYDNHVLVRQFVVHRLSQLVLLTRLFEQLLASHRPFHKLKRHYKAFASDFDGAKHLRVTLMEHGNSAAAVEQLVTKFVQEQWPSPLSDTPLDASILALSAPQLVDEAFDWQQHVHLAEPR